MVVSRLRPQKERKEKGKMQKKLKIGLIITTMLVLIGITYAAIMVTIQVGNIGSIRTTYGLEFQRVDGTVITQLDWGSDIDPPAMITPSDPSGLKYICNTGNQEIYIGWYVTDLPPWATLTCKYLEDTEWVPLPQNVFNVEKFHRQPDERINIKFILDIDSSASPGPFSFTINIIGADSPTG